MAEISGTAAAAELSLACKKRAPRVDDIADAVGTVRAAAEGIAARHADIAALESRTHAARARLANLVQRRGYARVDRLAGLLVAGGTADGDAPVPAEPPPVAGPVTGARSRTSGATAPLDRHLRIAFRELADWAEEMALVFRHDTVMAARIDRTTADLPDIGVMLGTLPALRAELDLLEQERRRCELAHELARQQVQSVEQRRASRALDALSRVLPQLAVDPAAPADPAPVTVVRTVRDETDQHSDAVEPSAWPMEPPYWSHEVVGMLDTPGVGPEQPDVLVLDDETLLLAGWALTAEAPITRVEIRIDGREVGRARLGYVRDDVRGRYRQAGPHARLSGFDFLCGPEHFIGRDEVAVEVVAHTRDGRRHTLATRTVAIARSTPATSSRLPAAAPRPTGAGGDPLHLLVFTHDLGYGGGQLWLSEWLDRSGAGRDYPCTVVSPSSGPLAADLRRLGVTVHVNGWVPVEDLEMHDGRIAECVGWAKASGFTAVLANTFLAHAGAVVAARAGLPLVWAIHESWRPPTFWSVAYAPGFLDRGVRQEAMEALGRADAVVFEAQATLELYDEFVRPGAAAVVPYGIATAAIESYCRQVSPAEARRQLGLDESARVLLVMGTVEARKCQTILALAFAEVAKRHPDALLVLVGGSSTPYAVGLQAYLDEAGLADRVRMVPVVSDAYPWYRAADALVCGSDIESLPRSVLEAMAFGLPVAATSVFGLPELLTDGVTGLLFEPGDLTSAVAGLERLLDLPAADLVAVGRAGRQLAVERHDSAGYARSIRRLLEAGGAA